MAIAEQTSPGPRVQTARPPKAIVAYRGLMAAAVILVAILLLPTPADLPIAGHRMLAVLGFAIVVWSPRPSIMPSAPSSLPR